LTFSILKGLVWR